MRHCGGFPDWIQLDFNGDVRDSEIYALVKRAYEIVKAKYSRKRG